MVLGLCPDRLAFVYICCTSTLTWTKPSNLFLLKNTQTISPKKIWS